MTSFAFLPAGPPSGARWLLVSIGALFGLATLLVLAALAPSLTGSKTYTVMGGSMEPAVPLGAAVVVSRVVPEDLRPGDVITYHTTTGPVTHRIIGADDRGFQTKGDANETADAAPVQPGSVLGLARYHVPFAGYLIYFGSHPAGRAVMMAAGGLLLAYCFLTRPHAHRQAEAESPA